MYKKSVGGRILAFFIDILMMFIVGVILHLLFGFGTLVRNGNNVSFNLDFLEFTLVSSVYYLFFAITLKGRTIGKLITKLEIKDLELQELPLKKIVLREFLKTILMFVSIISFVFVLYRGDRKSFHDLVVDSIVIRPVTRQEFMYKEEATDTLEEKKDY